MERFVWCSFLEPAHYPRSLLYSGLVTEVLKNPSLRCVLLTYKTGDVATRALFTV